MSAGTIVLAAVACAVIGLLLIVPGIKDCVGNIFISRASETATGEIIRVKGKWTNGSFCRGVVAYYSDGKRVEGALCHFIDGEEFHEGDAVSIVYNPKHTKHVMLDGLNTYRAFSTSFFMMGIGSLVFSLFARLMLVFFQ